MGAAKVVGSAVCFIYIKKYMYYYKDNHTPPPFLEAGISTFPNP